MIDCRNVFSKMEANCGKERIAFALSRIKLKQVLNHQKGIPSPHSLKLIYTYIVPAGIIIKSILFQQIYGNSQ